MSTADASAIEAGTPGFVLMDRAGRAVARSVIRALGGRYGRRVAIVCGKGNNGGDGFVTARVLLREGLMPRCLTVGDHSSLGGDAARHRDLFIAAGGRIEAFDPALLEGSDAIVDAIFGTGFRGTAEGDAARAINAINSHPGLTVSIDIPSGVDGTRGTVDGAAVRADTLVALGAQKIGSAVGAGVEHSGDVEIVDIGIQVKNALAAVPSAWDVDRIVPRRKSDAHKRSVGSVAILGGSEGMSGAAILTARAALRMGAGYATIGLPRSIDPIVSSLLPEVLTVVLTDEPHLSQGSLVGFKSVADRADAVAIGPGLGAGQEQERLVRGLLLEVTKPLVVDADGLNVLASDTSTLSDRELPTVLTPHPAELARLMQTDTETIQADRTGAALAAAERFDCVCVLKGTRSLIAAPDGRLIVNPTGSAHLATAGTGDVLTGCVLALLAAGAEAFEAAWAATYLHGLAGEFAAARHHGHGVVAWDVAEAIPEALKSVEG